MRPGLDDNMSASLQDALSRIENTENRMGNLDPMLQENQRIGAKKDAKRQKELAKCQADLEASRN